ncbi:unnamed protein product [Microthlaspi erraticum]|uniref:DUF4283 domain-containing protein n=1 Tax=Microthlaspi erraticum TaxID=1685480 RepID=A0A6D2K4L8_9BRAS|nr:unnamed protein product [Microthlaspi erraticum]
MNARIPYADKRKGIAYQTDSNQRKRIRAPELDTSDLVRENRLTLIGRLTNPTEQRMRAMFTFFLDRWELKRGFEGSDLGHDSFQLRFTLEEDLQKVLKNRPYQFGRWMVIIQRWEPVISPLFPSQIPFWIRLKGLPLHYWKEELLRNIDKEIGSLINHEVTKAEAKIHVSINALEPLVKETVIEFASGEEALVTLEYERLGFHCSICNKLSHVSRDCKISDTTTTKNKYRDQEGPEREPEGRGETTRKERERTRDFSQRRDRHGQSFGERGRYNNPTREESRERYVESRTHQPERANRVVQEREFYHGNREPPRSNGYGRRDMREYLNHRGSGGGRYTQERLQWREKTQEGEKRQGSVPTRELQTAYLTPPRQEAPHQTPGIPTTEQVMEELREVTIRYVNCPDPVENAARQQRVNQSEEQGLMATTASNIITAATESYYRTLNFGQEEHNLVQEDSEETEDQNEATHTETELTSPKKQADESDKLQCGRTISSEHVGSKGRYTRVKWTQTSGRDHTGYYKSDGGFSVTGRSNSLKIASRNCCGLGNPATIQQLRGIQSSIRPDILFLMETKNPDDVVLQKLQGMDYDSNTKEVVLRHVVYGEPDQTKRQEVWEMIMNQTQDRTDPWLLTGDFNEIIESAEKKGGPVRPESSFTNFRTFMSECDLYDLRFSGNFLSWRGVRNKHLVRCRLDRSMSNSAWAEDYPSGRSEYLSFKGSDHRPIITNFDTTRKRRKGLFRYDRRLKENVEVSQLISDAWNTRELNTVEGKIGRCRREIIRWNKQRHLNSQEQIEKYRQNLETAMTEELNNTTLIEELNALLKKAYDEEEAFWKQRSR